MRGHIWTPTPLALIGQAVSEKKMFENNGHVQYMYKAPGQGPTAPWDQNLFKNINLLLIWSFAASFNDFVTFFFFIQTYSRPNLTLV